MAPTPANFEVEHDFLKTVLPMVILNSVWERPNFIWFLIPQDFWHAQKGTRIRYIYTLNLYIFDFEQFRSNFLDPPFLNDQYARGVVVCCAGHVASLLASLALYFACLLAWLDCLLAELCLALLTLSAMLGLLALYFFLLSLTALSSLAHRARFASSPK